MATAVGALYLQVIASQSDLDAAVVWFFASLIFAVVFATLAAAFVASAALRVYLGVGATALLLFSGILGIFTIGMPLLAAGVLTLAGTVRAYRLAEVSPALTVAVAVGALLAASVLFSIAFTIGG